MGNRGMDDVGQLGTTDVQRAERHSGSTDMLLVQRTAQTNRWDTAKRRSGEKHGDPSDFRHSRERVMATIFCQTH